MAGITSASTALPQAGATSGSLTTADIDGLRAAGIPDDIIGVADRTRAANMTDAAPTTTPTTQSAPTGVTDATEQATNLDTPDETYPTLLKSHVMVFRAIGTPAGVIAGIAADHPTAGTVEQYIKSEILQNPEGWDAYVGNPSGTARAGLQQLMPGVQLPAPGTGTPGVAADGTTMTPNIPGVTAPIIDPAGTPADGANQLMKMLVWGAVGVGAAFVGWKFLKNRNAAKAAVAAVTGGGAAAGGGAATGAAAVANGFAKTAATGASHAAGATTAAASAASSTADDLAQLVGKLRGAGGASDDVLTAYILSQGSLAGSPAMLHQARTGLAPAHEMLSQLANGARNYNLDPKLVLKWDILHTAAANGGLSSVLGSGAGAGNLAKGVDDLLRGAAHVL